MLPLGAGSVLSLADVESLESVYSEREEAPVSAAPQVKLVATGSASALDDDYREVDGVRRQALFREMNEEIRRIADSFGVDDELDLVCECEHGDCFARISVLRDEYEAVRRFPTRFLLKPDHVGPEERIVEEGRYLVVEKIGAAAETAILLDPGRRGTGRRPAA